MSIIKFYTPYNRFYNSFFFCDMEINLVVFFYFKSVMVVLPIGLFTSTFVFIYNIFAINFIFI